MCVVCLATLLSQRLTNYGSIQWSMILQKRRRKRRRREIDEEDDARQRTWRYVCIYVCMAVIKLSLDTQLQAVVIGLKSANREWWLLVIMNEDDWLLLFLFQASRGTTLILLVFFFYYIHWSLVSTWTMRQNINNLYIHAKQVSMTTSNEQPSGRIIIKLKKIINSIRFFSSSFSSYFVSFYIHTYILVILILIRNDVYHLTL